VDDVDCVDAGQDGGYLGANTRHSGDPQRRVVVVGVIDELLHGRSAQKLHDEPDPTAAVGERVDARVEDRGNARMLQAGGGADLPAEPLLVDRLLFLEGDPLRAARLAGRVAWRPDSSLMATGRSRRSS
jgi:hypothetical protein